MSQLGSDIPPPPGAHIPPPPEVHNLNQEAHTQHFPRSPSARLLEIPRGVDTSGRMVPPGTNLQNSAFLPRQAAQAMPFPLHSIGPNPVARPSMAEQNPLTGSYQMPSIPQYSPQTSLYYPPHSYVTPSGYYPSGGAPGTYLPGNPGTNWAPAFSSRMYLAPGFSATYPMFPLAPQRPITPAAPYTPAELVVGPNPPGRAHNVPPRNLDHEFVAVRSINTGETDSNPQNLSAARDPPQQSRLGTSRNFNVTSREEGPARRLLQEGQGDSRERAFEAEPDQVSERERAPTPQIEQEFVYPRERGESRRRSRSRQHRERSPRRGRDRTRRENRSDRRDLPSPSRGINMA